MGLDCISAENLAKVKRISRFVSETANMIPLSNRPFVGKSAFAHKGGIHVSAIMKQPRAYEHMDPEIVGNSRRVLVSDLAGQKQYRVQGQGIGNQTGWQWFQYPGNRERASKTSNSKAINSTLLTALLKF